MTDVRLACCSPHGSAPAEYWAESNAWPGLTGIGPGPFEAVRDLLRLAGVPGNPAVVLDEGRPPEWAVVITKDDEGPPRT